MIKSSDILEAAQKLVAHCIDRKLQISVAESCTGGMVSAYITSVAGGSKVFGYGVVSYSESAKTQLLGVPPQLIAEYGAVSSQVAEAMALGALQLSGADYAVSITGIAGPDGGSSTNPVGIVYIGIASNSEATSACQQFQGARQDVREQASLAALMAISAAAGYKI